MIISNVDLHTNVTQVNLNTSVVTPSPFNITKIKLIPVKGEKGDSGVSDSDAVKTALLNCFAHVAWADDQGQTYYNALHDAFYPPASLVSISAVYTQGGTVYTTDSLDSLKTDLVVTATWDDSTTTTLDDADYTLSGTLEEGTSTITVTYGGMTATFDVTVSTYSTQPIILTEGKCWSKTAPNMVSKAGFGVSKWYNYTFSQATLEGCTYWDDTNQYMTTTGWCGIKYYISDVNTLTAGYSWPSSANYKNVLGKDEVYTYNFTMTKNAAANMLFGRQNLTCVAANGASFSLPLLDLDDCYAYWYKPYAGSVLPDGVQAGDIIFAGQNTAYYGLHNISEAST